MEHENKKIDDSLCPISYDIELTFYSRRTMSEVGKINTIMTWYMGKIICTGLFPEESTMVDVITDMISGNEKQDIKADTIREYSPDFDIMISMERKVLCT